MPSKFQITVQVMSSKRKRLSSRAGRADSQPQTPTEKKRPKLDYPQPMQTDGPLNGNIGHSLAETFIGACSRIGELLRRVNDLKGNRDETKLAAVRICVCFCA